MLDRLLARHQLAADCCHVSRYVYSTPKTAVVIPRGVEVSVVLQPIATLARADPSPAPERAVERAHVIVTDPEGDFVDGEVGVREQTQGECVARTRQ